MKKLAAKLVMGLALTFLFNACASHPEEIVTEKPTGDTNTVPGEKVSDEGRIAPGAGPNAGVRW
jgi:hypothetical protein